MLEFDNTFDPKATVAGQMDGLLSKNNPYMKAADTIGKQRGNQLGTLNSSMTVGAIENERIKAALPIAQQDAKALTDSSLVNQTFQNDLGKLEKQGEITGLLSAQDATQKMNLEKFSQGATTDRFMADLAQKNTAQLSEALKTLGQQYQNDYQQILTSTSFADNTARNTALTKLQGQYKANANLVSSLDGVDLQWD